MSVPGISALERGVEAAFPGVAFLCISKAEALSAPSSRRAWWSHGLWFGQAGRQRPLRTCCGCRPRQRCKSVGEHNTPLALYWSVW